MTREDLERLAEEIRSQMPFPQESMQAWQISFLQSSMADVLRVAATEPDSATAALAVEKATDYMTRVKNAKIRVEALREARGDQPLP